MIREYSDFELSLHHFGFLIWIGWAKRVVYPVNTQELREATIFIDCHNFILTKKGLIAQLFVTCCEHPLT